MVEGQAVLSEQEARKLLRLSKFTYKLVQKLISGTLAKLLQ